MKTFIRVSLITIALVVTIFVGVFITKKQNNMDVAGNNDVVSSTEILTTEQLTTEKKTENFGKEKDTKSIVVDEKTTERSTIQRTRSQATTEQGTARPQAITEQATTQAATQQPATQQPATQQPATQQPATQQPATQQPTTQQPTTQHEHEWQPIREMEFRRYCSTCHMDLTSAGIDPETHSINSGTYIVDVGGTPMEFYNCAGSYGGYEYITVGYFCHCGATKTCNEE